MDDPREAEQNRRIEDAVRSEQGRLRRFIRGRLDDRDLVEDILQDVFFELMVAYRLMKPVEHVGAWLFRVARNRIYDVFRKQNSTPVEESTWNTHDGEPFRLDAWLPSTEAGPEAAYARSVMFNELEYAIDELPDDQRTVFIAHELEGRTFKELAAETGLSVNTLLSRKRYAVLRLRRQLKDIYDYLADVQGDNK